MSRSTFAATAALALQLALFSGIATGQEPAAPPKVTVLLIYRPGPSWVVGKPLSEQPLGEHGKYMMSLYTKGNLKSAGPFTDDAGGAVVLEVPSFDAARQIAAEDPAVKAGVFVPELHPWGLVDWKKFQKPPSPK